MIAVSCMSVITIILFFGDNNVNLLLHRTDTIHIQMQRRQRWRWGHRRHRKRHSTTSIESAFIFEVRARVEWTRYFWSLDEIKSQFYNLFFFFWGRNVIKFELCYFMRWRLFLTAILSVIIGFIFVKISWYLDCDGFYEIKHISNSIIYHVILFRSYIFNRIKPKTCSTSLPIEFFGFYLGFFNFITKIRRGKHSGVE